MALTPNLSTTFPYEFYTHVRYGAYPECFDEAHPQELHGPAPPGCGNNTHAAVTKPAAKALAAVVVTHYIPLLSSPSLNAIAGAHLAS